MQIDQPDGILRDAAQSPSPHWNERPAGAAVSLIVLHGISLPPGRFGGPWIDELFLGRLATAAHPAFASLAGVRVSSHLLLRRSGELAQFVPFTHRAWHAGVSRFDGRDNCNDFAIGIELEGEDHTPYTPAQYQRLTPLLQALMVAYPAITPERIVGHCDVAPGRKTDPGPAFDWAYVRERIER